MLILTPPVVFANLHRASSLLSRRGHVPYLCRKGLGLSSWASGGEGLRLIHTHAVYEQHQRYDALLQLEMAWRNMPSRVTNQREMLIKVKISVRVFDTGSYDLLQLASRLSCDESHIMRALKMDDSSLYKMLEHVLVHEQEEVIALRDDDAATFLSLVHAVSTMLLFLSAARPAHCLLMETLDAFTDVHLRQSSWMLWKQREESECFEKLLRRTGVRLSMASLILPEGMYLTGVALRDTRLASGGYADIHMGTFRGERVALKVMRGITRHGQPSEVAKLLKVP